MPPGSRKVELVPAVAGLAALAVAVVVVAVGWGDDDDGAPPGSGPETSEPAPPTSEPSGAPPELLLVAAPSESQPVGPPVDSPLALVRRDCGSSEPLPGGGRIWLYCDTTMFDPGGRLRWFVNSSAAVATDDEPLVMLESTDLDGRVEPVIEPRNTYPRCQEGEGRFTWPTAAVPVEGADEPQLAIFYENVCVVPRDFVGHDSGLAALGLASGSAEDLAAAPIRAAIIEDRLFPRTEGTSPFGQAAVRVDDDVYAYRCPRSDVACSVARAPAQLDALADRTAWEVWDGTGWVPHGDDGSAAAPMEMPDPSRGFKPSVAWLDDLGVYVWVDHLVFGPSQLDVRVADQPWGPWSQPLRVQLPGCNSDWPDVCFAAEVHEHLSGPGRIGLTWFDPTFPAGEAVPLRHATVEVAVVRGEP